MKSWHGTCPQTIKIMLDKNSEMSYFRFVEAGDMDRGCDYDEYNFSR